MSDRQSSRVYFLCSFDIDALVPRVEFIDAETDQDAVAMARRRMFTTRRELWDHHRLVANIPAQH